MLRPLLPLFVALLAACAPDPGAGAPAGDPDAQAPELHPGPATEEPAVLPDDCSTPSHCTAPYLRFLQLAAEHRRPIDPDALRAQLDAITDDNHETVQARPDAAALRAALMDALRLDFLLRDRALPVVTRGEPRIGPDWTETDLVLRDRWVGELRALLLTPHAAAKGAVLALPGHGELPSQHRDLRGGAELVRAGHVVLIPELRVNDGHGVSAAVSRRFLLAGHSFIGLRTYEAIVAFDALAALPEAAGRAAFVQGHSGGSVVGQLLVRVHDGPRGLVADLTSTYGVPGGQAGSVSDETSPALYRWHPWIEEPGTSPVPILMQEYEYPAGFGPTLSFLAKHRP